MNYSDLTERQQEMLKDCATPEDLLELAKDEGVELTDDQLELVSGGRFDLAKWIDDFSRAPQM